MGDLIKINDRISVFERDGKLWTTSLNVADVFEKRHQHVMESIRNLDCSAYFNGSNFRLVDYQDRKGETRPMYEMTRDGFSFLVMGFTGAKAAKFKEDYINAFNILLEQSEKNLRMTANHAVNLEKMSQETSVMFNETMRCLQIVSKNMLRLSNGVDVVDGKVDVVDKKVDRIDKRLKVVEDDLTTRRKNISKPNKRTHLSFTTYQYRGMCPNCQEIQIIGPCIIELPELNWDHHRGRYETALDKTWPICEVCNNAKSNGNMSDREVEIHFQDYQARLEKWLKNNAPQQTSFLSNAKEIKK